MFSFWSPWLYSVGVSTPAELSFEHLPSIVLLVRLNSWVIEAANAGARGIFGSTAEGSSLDSYLSEEEHERLKAKVDDPQAAERVIAGELTIRGHEGRDVPLGYTSRIIPGEVARLLIVARDLSGGVSSYSRLASLFDETSDAIVMWDSSGRALEANAAFLTLSGLDRATFRGKPMSELMPVEPTASEKPFDTSILTSEPHVAVLVTAKRITTEDRTVTAAVVIDQQTVRRREALDRSFVQAQRLEALGRLSAGIAHDFNNMLMAALPWADLIRRKYPEDETLVRASDHIRRAVHRARDVTRQLLDFAQPRTPEPRMIDMNQLVHQQQKLLRAAIPEQVGLTAVVPAEKVEAFIDGAQISQALLNLGLFAREAVDQNGEIRIILEDRSNADPESECSVRIEWTGSPLSRRQQSVLFDPFTPVDEGKGGGLGLAVARRIVEQNHGRVIVSTSARSTTLNVLLPQTAPARPISEEADEHDIRGCSILMIDDEVDSLSGLIPLLESRGALIHLASNAADAIALAARSAADIAVIDAGLEEMSAPVLAATLREVRPGIAILISSGGSREDLDLPPGTQFLRKPYELSELLQTIRAADGERKR